MAKDEKVYLVLKRRVVWTTLIVYICLFLGIISSFQYADYVDRRSNQRWCGVVSLFNESYRELPPSTELGRKIQSEMALLPGQFSCKNT